MPKLSHVVAVIVVALLVTGVVYLLRWDIPAPSATVEKIIPDDRFER